MIEVTLTIDKFGRVLLPKEIRGNFTSHKLVARKEKGGILLKPVPSWDEVFGSCPNIDMKKFAKQHEEESRE